MVYKFTIAPEGAIGSPFRSDTLWFLPAGQCCTNTVMTGLRAGLMQQSKKPEMVFSDGFPSGWLPRPLIPRKISDSVSVQQKAMLKRYQS